MEKDWVVWAGKALFLWVLSHLLHGLFSYARWGFLDTPNSRSLHEKPTPKSAGLVFGSLFLCSCLFLFGGETLFDHPSLLLWLGGFLGFFCIGLLDDKHSLPSLARLVLEFLLLGGMVFATQPEISFLEFRSEYLSLLFVLVLVFGINLVNFMDGMDGYVSLHFLLSSAFLPFFFPERLAPLQLSFQIILLWILSYSGFLFGNLPPAKFFMGDVGSLCFGYVWMTLAWFFPSATPSQGTSGFPLESLFFLFPVFWVDGITTLLHRLFQRKNILLAHREHLYQLLAQTRIKKTGSLLLALALNLPAWILGSLRVLGPREILGLVVLYFLGFGLLRFQLLRGKNLALT